MEMTHCTASILTSSVFAELVLHKSYFHKHFEFFLDLINGYRINSISV